MLDSNVVFGSFVAFFSLCLSTYALGYFAGGRAEEKKWQNFLIDRGLALYDPKTGKWRWKDEEPKP